MPVHDWTRVDAGIFHDFHQAWNAELRRALNGGLLPPDFYALIEHHAGRPIPDLLTLHTGPLRDPMPDPSGGVAVAEARPKVSRRLVGANATRRRTIAIRHVKGHRLVAVVEIVSPSNKDRAEHVRVFAEKAADALRAGVHVLVIDLFPPGRYDPHGIAGAIWSRLDGDDGPVAIPAEKPLTVASYLASWTPEVWLESLAVGDALPDMPLFLTEEVCLPIPLEATYSAGFATEAFFWRDVLEGRRDAPA